MMRLLAIVLCVLPLGWALSLALFVTSMPHAPLPAEQKTDAIVVLTGGAERVERGLDMLSAQAAPLLFVSGVGPHVTIRQLLEAHASSATRLALLQKTPHIVLDYTAASTKSNAAQTRTFVQARRIGSIRLITAGYHMPRSLLEFQRAMPDLLIAADPVSPEGFRRDAWWRHANTRRLVLSEYWKYLGALLRPMDTAG